VKGLWRANRYSIPQSPESKVTLYNDNDSNKSKAEMADQPFWKSGVFYVPLSVFSKDLGVNVIQSKDGGFIKVADTSYKRGEDERKSDREFSKEVADELFLKIPFDDEFDGTLNSQCGYNIKGKVYSYDDAYVDIYSDGTVNFLDSETGKITKTINVYDNEYKY